VPVKVQVPQKAPLVRILLSPPGKIFLALFVACIVVAITTFTYYYVKYSNLIEAKLKAGPFATTSMLLAAPEPVEVGEVTSPEQIAFQLRRAGLCERAGRERERQACHRDDPSSLSPLPLHRRLPCGGQTKSP